MRTANIQLFSISAKRISLCRRSGGSFLPMPEEEALDLPKYLIISRLQRDNGPSSLQFRRLRSNRFGENRLTDACRAVFSKQAAPRSHAFFSCHEPLSPGTRCGELRGELSSREPDSESLKRRKPPRWSRSAGSIGLCGGSYCRQGGLRRRGRQQIARTL